MDWTPELKDTVRRLRAAGHTTSVIAKRLGTTRNAVLGIAHREGMPAPKGRQPVHRTPEEMRERLAEYKRRWRAKREALPPRVADLVGAFSDPEGVIPSVGVSLLDAGPSQCRYFLSDGRVCGNRTRGDSYCPGHMLMVYVPSTRLRRRVQAELAA